MSCELPLLATCEPAILYSVVCRCESLPFVCKFANRSREFFVAWEPPGWGLRVQCKSKNVLVDGKLMVVQSSETRECSEAQSLRESETESASASSFSI